MRSTLVSVAVLLALGVSHVQAAVKQYDVKYRFAIMEDNRLLHEPRRQSFGFRVEVVSDPEGVKPESSMNGRPFITAVKGERYSVRLYNPLPVRVAVNLTVDGLNSITGKPSGIADGHKWMIDPYGTVTILGWQVNNGEARRFFFTDKPKSYAKWLGDRRGQDLDANCGVIGAAFFWNQEDLDRYYEDHPIYRTTERPWPFSSAHSKTAGRATASPACAESAMNQGMKKAEDKEQAGTGMGERESHPTMQVAFDYNRGMYNVDQALLIYYGFEDKRVPNPFPAMGYAPEMP